MLLSTNLAQINGKLRGRGVAIKKLKSWIMLTLASDSWKRLIRVAIDVLIKGHDN